MKRKQTLPYVGEDKQDGSVPNIVAGDFDGVPSGGSGPGKL